MALFVQKYGGTSVGDLEKMKKIARYLKGLAKDNQLVVIVSAMADATDQLIAKAKLITAEVTDSNRFGKEMDMLMAVGEQESAALLAIYLKSEGTKAEALLAGQIGLETDSRHGQAKIIKIAQVDKIKALLGQGAIVVIAGFQGVAAETNNITTLGRGGSDTSAVALAAALQADSCEIYTDVDGVYSVDPRFVPGAKKYQQISYSHMITLAKRRRRSHA